MREENGRESEEAASLMSLRLDGLGRVMGVGEDAVNSMLGKDAGARNGMHSGAMSSAVRLTRAASPPRCIIFGGVAHPERFPSTTCLITP
jgi:hypothetical protein